MARAVIAAQLVMLVAGAAVLVTGLAAHLSRVAALHEALQPGIAGGIAVLLLQLGFAPNALVWSASYALGSGFSLGAGSVVAPAATELGILPGIPFLGALPSPGPGDLMELWWLAAGAAAGAIACWVLLAARPAVRFDVASLMGGACGLLAGVAFAGLAWAASGDLGTLRLTGLGPRLFPLLIMAATTMGLSGMITGLALGLIPRRGRSQIAIPMTNNTIKHRAPPARDERHAFRPEPRRVGGLHARSAQRASNTASGAIKHSTRLCVVPEPLASTRLGRAARLVILISGSGTLLQALIDACADPAYGAQIVAVGSDRTDIQGLARAMSAGIPTFVLAVSDYATRADWDRALTAKVAGYEPDLVISAGFMKLLGAEFLDCFEGRIINTHPALLPSFPGMHGPRDALAYGVKVTGATVFLVDAGVDSGVILDQQAVPVADDDTVETLHERIKVVERELLVAITHQLATRTWRVADRKVLWT